jgi:pimeloyl-ACP methyl ester carboxylesterase
VHQRSKNPNAVPLLLLNGWPSSLAEYAKVIMPLVDPAAHGAPADQAFHVVIPSMPGFGFSGKRTTYGYTPDRMARMWAHADGAP